VIDKKTQKNKQMGIKLIDDHNLLHFCIVN
jgi:hypothetical protein